MNDDRIAATSARPPLGTMKPRSGPVDTAAQRLEALRVERAVPGASVTIELVTPDRANELLSRNIANNRPVTMGRVVDSLCADIEAGAWRLSTDAIGIDDRGQLINGQHRLLAIVRTGRTLPLVVLTGVPTETFDVLDRGKGRTFGDTLRLYGVANHSAIAAVVVLVAFWESTGVPRRAGVISNARLLAVHNADPDGFANALRQGDRITKRWGFGRSAFATMCYMMNKADETGDDIDGFEEALRFGTLNDVPLEPGHPMHTLRETTTRDIMMPRSVYRRDTYLLMAITVKAWNAYRSGQQLKLLKFRAGGANPDTFPVLI